MPYINDDGSIDNVLGYIIKCDLCGFIEKVFDAKTDTYVGRHEEHSDLENGIYFLFSGCRGPDLPEAICVDCMKRILPSLHRLRDAIELDIFVNRLGKAINEKRKQGNTNNRATSHNAGERRKRGYERRFGYRTCNSIAQTCEEHF